jgi:aminoglycoside/choline kinase family phosphotransferase
MSLDPRVAGFLEERGKEARVEALSGDASTRCYFRVREAGKTAVLALYPEPFVTAELPFFSLRGLFSRFGLPVPEIRDDDGPRGILLLEDLGDDTLQDVMQRGGDPARFYGVALEQIATLQREGARASETDAPCFSLAFDTEKLSFELHYFLKHFVEGLRGCELSESERGAVSEAFHALSQEIASWPRVVCHRDFHSRNLMPRDGVLYWIDFQDARMGPATYDLASLLNDSYVDLPEGFVLESAEAFRRRALPGEDRETFVRRFEIVSVQRTLKALGTFGYMVKVRGKTVYLPSIPRALASARRNLARRAELAALRRVLAPHIEEFE